MQMGLVSELKLLLSESTEISGALAITVLLTRHLEKENITTMAEFSIKAKRLEKQVQEETGNGIAVKVGGNLLSRIVTALYNSLSQPAYSDFIRELSLRSKLLHKDGLEIYRKIADNAFDYLPDRGTVLIHGYSQCCLFVILKAISQGKSFKILVTEARPEKSGHVLIEALQTKGVEARLLADTAILTTMPQIDFVILGAEIILMNGGVVNAIGSNQVAFLAKHFHHPVYVCAECYKIVLEDVPDLTLRSTPFCPSQATEPSLVEKELFLKQPLIESVPARNISLFITDSGVFSPLRISHETIKATT